MAQGPHVDCQGEGVQAVTGSSFSHTGREEDMYLRPGVVGVAAALLWVLVVYALYFYPKLVQIWPKVNSLLNSLFRSWEHGL